MGHRNDTDPRKEHVGLAVLSSEWEEPTEEVEQVIELCEDDWEEITQPDLPRPPPQPLAAVDDDDDDDDD